MIKYKNHRRPFIMANRKKEVYKPKPSKRQTTRLGELVFL